MTAATDYARALEDLASRQRRSDNALTRAHGEVNAALAAKVRADDAAMVSIPAEREQTSWAPGDTPYRPPSIADGTVARGLVDTLQVLVDEYGYKGVTSTLEEIGMMPLPPGGWIVTLTKTPIVLDVNCPACRQPGKVLASIHPKVRPGELSADIDALQATPHECPATAHREASFPVVEPASTFSPPPVVTP